MKRAKLIKNIRKIAKDANVTIEFVEGGKHTKIEFDGQFVTTIARHPDVPEITAKGAIKAAEKWVADNTKDDDENEEEK